ncbi:hypothetical protein [Blastococcus sp. SYSU D00820]
MSRESVVAASTQPLGPVATAIVAGILIAAGAAVVVGYLAIELRWRRGARHRDQRESGEQPPEAV